MNKEAMLAVADVIEYADRFMLDRWATRIDESGNTIDPFNASGEYIDPMCLIPSVWEDCGTAACIAGWTCAWAETPKEQLQSRAIERLAGQELGLSDAQSIRLFCSPSWWENQGFQFGDVTAKQASSVMRDIANGVIEL